MIRTIKNISDEFGFTEEEIRSMVVEYINHRSNMIFNWEEFYEQILIIENRDKKLEKILKKD